MLRSSKFLLVMCAASLCFACSSSPQVVDDGAAGSDGATADGAQPDGAQPDGAQPDGDAAVVAEGGQPNAAEAGAGEDASESRSDGQDVRLVDMRSGDAPIDAAKPDVAAEAAPDRPPAKASNGGQCTGNGGCQSGICVSGVCCATACNSGCTACVMAKTGKPDGTCAPDKGLDKQKCGTACSNLAMGVAGVVQKVCENGSCVVSPLLKIDEICQVEDKCTTSFCDQQDPNTARCVNTVCPQQGSCCCGAPGGAKMCAQKAACTGERSCM